MKKRTKVILIVVCLFILLGVIFGIIDYNRIKNGKNPMFMIRISDTSKSNDEYLGLGYRFKRTVEVSYTEPITNDQNAKFGLWIYTWKISINNEITLKQYAYELLTVESINCNNIAKLYYTDNDRSIYTYCLDSIKINDGTSATDLNEYIKNNSKTMEEIINTLTLETSLYDGGTNIYKDGGTKEFTNNGITLIKCNTLDGNKDIYIGPKDMGFKENFCKSNNKTFVRTYTINSIEEYTEQQYEDGTPVTYANSFKVKLSQFQAETETVIINNINEELKVNQTYEFEFMLNDNVKNINDDIESIFKNSTIIDIRKTNKTGLDQLQDGLN